MTIRAIAVTLGDTEGTTITVPGSALNLINTIQNSETPFNKVDFIRAMRAHYDLSLVDAKYICDLACLAAYIAERPSNNATGEQLVGLTWKE